MAICNDLIKRRVIRFRDKDPDVTARARELLSAVQGVSGTRVLRPGVISIHYDIRHLSLQMIERALADVGFSLNENIFCRVKRSLIAYCEDNLREELEEIERSEQQEGEHQEGHHAHDPRPYHWRNYS